MRALTPEEAARMTPEERSNYGRMRLHWMGRPRGIYAERRRGSGSAGASPCRVKPDIMAAIETTIVGRDKIIGRPAFSMPPKAKLSQGDFFTAPKSDPVKAAAALAELRKFKEQLT